MEGRKVGMEEENEVRNEAGKIRMGGRREGRNEGREEGRNEGRKDGRTEGWKEGGMAFKTSRHFRWETHKHE